MIDHAALHLEVTVFAANRAKLEHALGGLLCRLEAAEIWKSYGLANLAEYAERYLLLKPRQTEERLRIARALDHLPRINAAMEGGTLNYSAVRELTRVVKAPTEAEWVTKIQGRTMRQVEAMLSDKAPGDLPQDPPRPRRKRLVVEMSPAVHALYLEAQAKLRKDSGDDLKAEDALMLMCCKVLGGAGDDGQSPYQVRLTVCERCGHAEQAGMGKSIAIDRHDAERAQCDAQQIDSADRATQTIPPDVRRLVVDRHHGRCGVSGCRQRHFTEVHHVRHGDGGASDADRLILLCSAHHRALHRGGLRIEGTWSEGFRFHHANGSPSGALRDAFVAALMSDLESGLRKLGFKDRDCRDGG